MNYPWKDTPESHQRLHESFCDMVNRLPFLKDMRDWVEQNAWGFGERSFYWMWFEIIAHSPYEINFLEIGVYRGQILALIRKLADLLDKDCVITGISPLSGEDGYIEQDYYQDVVNIHKHFNLQFPKLIKGLSTDSSVVEEAAKSAPYDIIYIDGGHSTEVVRQDIKNYLPHLKSGGYLVMDDCCNKFNLPDGYFRGHESVSQAVDEVLPPFTHNKDFKFLFSIVHNRVWRKL